MRLNYMSQPVLGSFRHRGKGSRKKLPHIMKDFLGKAGWRTASAGGQQDRVKQGVDMPKQVTTANKKHPENGLGTNGICLGTFQRLEGQTEKKNHKNGPCGLKVPLGGYLGISLYPYYPGVYKML